MRQGRMVGLGAVLALGCGEPLCGDVGEASARTGRDGGGNVLIVLMDDVGVDVVERWAIGPRPAATPVLDCLCDRGLRFTQAWASPLCSPTRAELQTGRANRRLALGGILRNDESGYELAESEDTLGDLARREGYATGMFGKWHLADSARADALTHPNRSGYDRFAGTMANLANTTEGLGGTDFFTYQWVEDGEAAIVDGYVTSHTVDAALDFVSEVGEQPWLVMLSFHAPHVPLHEPPDSLVVEQRGSSEREEERQFLAMLQAADREVGRFLQGVSDDDLADTTILWMGDNGTVGSLMASELGGLPGKASLTESGLRVPAVMAGLAVDEAGMRGQVTDSVAHVVDVYPTVRDLIGGQDAGQVLDGRSWVSLLDAPEEEIHTTVPAALFGNIGGYPENLRQALRSETHKLIRREGEGDSLYRVGPDRLDDGPDLLEDALTAEDEAAYESLKRELQAFEASVADDLGWPLPG